jgi:hypothetical protein
MSINSINSDAKENSLLLRGGVIYLFNNRFWISREGARLTVYTESRRKLIGVTDLRSSFITVSVQYCRMVV